MIKQKSVGLDEEQLEWLNNNPEFDLSKFVRGILKEYIKFQNDIEEFKKETINS